MSQTCEESDTNIRRIYFTRMRLPRKDTAAFPLYWLSRIALDGIAPPAEEMLLDQSHLCLHHHLSNTHPLLHFLFKR